VKAEEYRERRLEVGGWTVNLASYRAGNEWHATADNVSPGAVLARTSGATREEAEDQALRRAEEKLARTRRIPA
jgi:ribosomal protein L16/L10AE